MAESELSRLVNEFLSKLQDGLKKAMNTMICSRCQGKNRGLKRTGNPRVPDTVLTVAGFVLLRKESSGQSQGCWASRSPVLH